MNNTPEPQPIDQKPINTNPFSRTFEGLDKLFKYNQTPAIIILIFSIFGGLFQLLGNIPGSFSDDSTPPTDSTAGDAAPSLEPESLFFAIAIMIAVLLVFGMIVLIIRTFVYGFISYVGYKTSRNESTTFSEAMRAVTGKFWTLFMVDVLSNLRILGGLLLFIVPGIRAMLRYQMAMYPVFDDNLRARDALRRIKHLTKGHLLEIFGITTVGGIIPIIGSLLALGGEAVMYPQLKGIKDQGVPKPPVHWLNYLGFILISAFILLMALVLVLIAAVVSSSK